MTKRDVAVWFCRAIALSGMISAAVSLLSALAGWKTMGGSSFIHAFPSLSLYFFVWLGARGLGTELAAEGEHGPPIESGAELGSLLVRCGGLMLFLAATLNFGVLSLTCAYQYFFAKNSFTPSYFQIMTPYLVGGFVQSVLGFALAFTPRIRRIFGK